MDNPQITSDKILSIISNKWLTNADIANELGLKHSLDKKYLNLKLQELNRKEEVAYDFDYLLDQVYWKKNNSEYLEELHVSFALTLLENDPFDAEIWNHLGNLNLEWNWFMGDGDADFYKMDIFTQINDCYKNALRFVDTEIDFKLYCDILLNLAMTYIMLEKPNEAQSKLEILLEFKEELGEEFIGRVYLRLAQAYLIKEEYDLALDYAIKSIEKIPNDWDVKMVLGKIRDSIMKDQGTETQNDSLAHQESDDTNLVFLQRELLKEMRKSIRTYRLEEI